MWCPISAPSCQPRWLLTNTSIIVEIILKIRIRMLGGRLIMIVMIFMIMTILLIMIFKVNKEQGRFVRRNVDHCAQCPSPQSWSPRSRSSSGCKTCGQISGDRRQEMTKDASFSNVAPRICQEDQETENWWWDHLLAPKASEASMGAFYFRERVNGCYHGARGYCYAIGVQ